MRIFKTKWFWRFARQQRIKDETLREAVQRVEAGLVDADLGGGVIKLRISRPNKGKSGGFRSIVLYRSGEKALFVYGFPKSERDNIDAKELRLSGRWPSRCSGTTMRHWGKLWSMAR